MQRDKLSKIHQIVLGTALGLAFIVTVEAILAIDDGVQISFFDSGEHRWSMTLRDGGERVKILSRGDVELLEDEGSMAVEVGPGGVLRVDARGRDAARRLEIREGAAIDYRVDGRQQDFDAAARLWLSDILLEAVRRGGFDAEQRAVRLYGELGAEGLLAEIVELGGDEVRRRYFTAVLDEGGVPAADLGALLEGAGRLVKGDHALGRILRETPPESLADDAVAAAYLGACRSISGDHEQRRSLAHVIDGPLSPASWDEFFDAARHIGSDHEAAQLIVAWAEIGRSSLPASLPAFASQIGSDYEQRRALAALFEGPLPAAARDRLLLAAAAGLGSDHEASELLRVHASHGRDTATPAALKLLGTIGGSNQLRAAVALLDSAAVEQLPALLGATDLPDHGRVQLLEAVTGVVSPESASPELRQAVDRVAAGIGSDSRRRQLLETWSL